MGDCLFCRIAKREIPAKIVLEDEQFLAFEDIRPQAPVHVLIIPKRHIASLNEAPEGAEALLGEALLRAREIARAKGVGTSGYRIVLNTARDSGQEVFHIHFHLLGGRRMTWPPG
ncbi:MAG TPA: histidine triad nucleotide-binding protein [Terriglobales bacterium]|nr:histidine triad nucleotide-binding protein [Terriglobales bacterium]